jgi:ribonucleoside-diphosphate reductase alpha chain
VQGGAHSTGHAKSVAANGNGHITLHAVRITGDLCPDCGTALVYEEGCNKCMGCGYARC